jgi:hypothetical protein
MTFEQGTLMKCGHTAQGTIAQTGDPVCAICLGIHPGATEVAEKPSLEDRFAHCVYGKHARVESDWKLPFFEYRGPGSPHGQDTCSSCHYARAVHERKARTNEPHLRSVCNEFKPIESAEEDLYYCGCFGWD